MVINDRSPSKTRTEIGLVLPKFESASSSLNRWKRKYFPSEAKERRDLEIPNEWKINNDGRNFLMIDDGDEDKIIAFATTDFLHELCNATDIFIDGTFKTCPKLFHQLYTFHIIVYGEMMPVIYALLPNKTADTYKRLFYLVKQKAEEKNWTFSPKAIHMDFEKSMISAKKIIFLEAIIIGFLFHFSQCIWRKVSF